MFTFRPGMRIRLVEKHPDRNESTFTLAPEQCTKDFLKEHFLEKQDDYWWFVDPRQLEEETCCQKDCCRKNKKTLDNDLNRAELRLETELQKINDSLNRCWAEIARLKTKSNE